MSQGGAEQVRRTAEAVKRGDIEAVIRDLASDVKWTPAFPVLLGREEPVYRGHDGVREMFRGSYDVLDEIDVECCGGADANPCRAQRDATKSPFAFVADLRTGKLVRVRTCLDPEEGLEAAGLRG